MTGTVTTVAPAARAVNALRTLRPSPARAAVLIVPALLMAWMLHARVRDLGAPLWIDEGISFGIAGHALTAIPGVLRQDGSPPLFYLLLHLWTGAFGTSPRAGHALSLLFAVLAVPAAAWAAGGVFGWRAGLVAAAIVALDPFTGLYAVEVRMYSLVLLLGLLATGAFLRAFVVRPGHRAWSAVLAVCLAAVFYTHNWGLFYGAAAGICWLGLLAGSPGRRRELLIGGVIGFGGAAVLFAPWLPILLDQMAHTGAPWSQAPHGASIRRAFERMLGGRLPETLLLVVAAGGLVELLRRNDRTLVRAVLAATGLAVLTFAIAFAWSSLSSPAWAMRYQSMVLAPLAIAVGAAMARTGALAAVALAVVFLGSWYGNPPHSALAHKSNAEIVAHRLGPGLPAGTLVFSTQPEVVPVLRYYLPRDRHLRFATPLGAVPDPGVVDWRDAMSRLRRARLGTGLAADLRALRPGQRLLLVQPRFSNATAPWTTRIRRLAHASLVLIEHDPSIRVVKRVIPTRGYSRSTVSGLLIERTPPAHGRSGAVHHA